MILEYNFDSYEDAASFLDFCDNNDNEDLSETTLNSISIHIDVTKDVI